MRKVILFNTAIGSHDVGDYTIKDDDLIVEYPTHTPVIRTCKSLYRNAYLRISYESSPKFIRGTNSIVLDMVRLLLNDNQEGAL